MSSIIALAPVTATCPPPSQGSGCAEGYTAACLSIHAQLHPRTTNSGLEPSQTDFATPRTHTLCCPRTWNGYREGIFAFTCAVHPEVTTWSVCHSVVQETWTETWTSAAVSNIDSVVTTTWLPGEDLFQPPVAPQEVAVSDTSCTPAPATFEGSQTLPMLPTTPIRKSTPTITEGTTTMTRATVTTTPVPASAAGVPDEIMRLKIVAGLVFFTLLCMEGL